jgi:hypothetical protein
LLLLSISCLIFNFVMLVSNYFLISCCSRNISFRQLPIDFPIIHFVMLINIYFLFLWCSGIYIFQEKPGLQSWFLEQHKIKFYTLHSSTKYHYVSFISSP